MFKYFGALLVAYLVEIGHSYKYYCNFSCGFKEAICALEPCYRHEYCGKHFQMVLFGDNERTFTAQIHNFYRSNIALGYLRSKYGNTRAGNMRAMSYNKELEFEAQCWANMCNKKGVETCRSSRDFDVVGQNMFTAPIEPAANVLNRKFLSNIFNDWFDEYQATDAFVIQQFGNTNNRKFQRYTQMAWALTTAVGCAAVLHGSGAKPVFLMYCNYGTSGNILNEPVYLNARNCSLCPQDYELRCQRTHVYRSLCGDSMSVEDDEFEPPYKIDGSLNLRQKNAVIMFGILLLGLV